MTTLTEATTATTFATRLVDRVARGLGRFSRRGFLVQTAVVGSALAVDPKGYVLTPQTAASTVCGPAASCSAGYTVMCCTINKGVNGCPPGTFAAGWWKAADSSWCGGGYRYIVDCNASCSKCTSGCSGDNICSSGCWSCGCKCGSSATCDQRRVCCNAFRYGQCNTHVRCSGGVACRVVSCIAPYKWANCTTTSLTDNATAEHSAPCLPRWDAITRKYVALGGEGSPLGVSTGPERAVGDGRGRYVTYQRGAIYWSSATGARAVRGSAISWYRQLGGPQGLLRYPSSDLLTARDGKGWIQLFEGGAITDSPQTVTHTVTLASYRTWVATGRETGELGYPVAERVMGSGGYWIQHFQRGAVADTPHSVTCRVTGWRYTQWRKHGGEHGVLGYPVSNLVVDGSKWLQLFEHGALADTPSSTTCLVSQGRFDHWTALGREKGVLGYPVSDQQVSGSSWVQLFENGALADTASSVTTHVFGPAYRRWLALDRERGVLGYPVRAQTDEVRSGHGQRFERGQLWWAAGATPWVVRGRVLTAWAADGGAAGRWGYPLEDTVVASDGTQHQRFEGGLLTA
ncbi:MAG: LGFP repeat-containing protein [Angustibacter sp.]